MTHDLHQKRIETLPGAMQWSYLAHGSGNDWAFYSQNEFYQLKSLVKVSCPLLLEFYLAKTWSGQSSATKPLLLVPGTQTGSQIWADTKTSDFSLYSPRVISSPVPTESFALCVRIWEYCKSNPFLEVPTLYLYQTSYGHVQPRFDLFWFFLLCYFFMP